MNRHSLIALFLLAACTSTRQLPPVSAALNGVLRVHCTWTAPYCGGAEPRPEDYPRPRPCTEPMFLRSATPDTSGRIAHNDVTLAPIDTIRFDTSGTWSRSVPAGAYLLLDADRLDDRTYRQLLREHRHGAMYTEPIDTSCLRKWLEGPFGVVVITHGDTTNIDLDLHDQCPWYNTPCVEYHGPLPP